MRGWVKLHRDIMADPIFKNERMFRIWSWILMKVSHEEQSLLVGLEPVQLKEGQLVFGLNRAAAELEIPTTTLYRYMKSLEKQGKITIDVKCHFSIITLTDWALSQHGAEGQQNDCGKVSETNNKGKNEKKDKKEYIGEAQKISFAEFVLMTAEQHADLVARYGEENTAAMIDLLNSHKGASGKTYKDDYFAIRNWCVKAVLEQKEAPALKSGKRNRFINYTDEHTDFSDVEAQALRRRQAKTSSA